MTPSISSELSNLSVRLSSNDHYIGSGILFEHEDILFVITAKHCVFDEEENTCLSNIKIDRWNSDNGMVNIIESVDKSDIFFDDDSTDIALLKIGKINLTDINSVSFCSSLPIDQADYFFQGFPAGIQSREPKLVSCKFGIANVNGFTVNSTITLESNSNVSENNVKNFSGSGVFFRYQESIYLVGVVTDFIEEFADFKIVNLHPTIDVLLNKAGLSKTTPFSLKTESIKSSDNEELLSIFKSRLSKIDDYIQSFKPQTALLEIEDLKLNIELSNLTETEVLLAECAYLEGQCNKLSGGSPEKSNSLFLKAIELNSSDLRYKELKPFILYNKNSTEESLLSAKSILLEDKRNVRAWAVIDYINQQAQNRGEIRNHSIYK
jgi:hypothetical protein